MVRRLVAIVVVVVLAGTVQSGGVAEAAPESSSAPAPSAAPKPMGKDSDGAAKDPSSATAEDEHPVGCALWESCFSGRCCGSGSCRSANATHAALGCGLWESCYQVCCGGSGFCKR